MKRRAASRYRTQGWSFVELAIVLAIAGLLVWMWPSAGGNLGVARERAEATDHLRQVSEAMRAYALREARLPCPAAGAPYWEDCTASSAVGVVPYRSLGLDPPASDLVARYAVYRQPNPDPGLDAELTRRLERTGDSPSSAYYQDVFDLIEALERAQAAGPDNARAYLTGDGAAPAEPADCMGYVHTNVAYWLISPLHDRDGDGVGFDAPHSIATSLCAAPLTTRPRFDDVVRFESPSSLAGWLMERAPR